MVSLPIDPVARPALIVAIGPPGCGKSTVAATWQGRSIDQPLIDPRPADRRIVSTDVIRGRLFGDPKIQGAWAMIWPEVVQEWQAAIADQVAAVFYDATNIDRSIRQPVITTARSVGFAWLEAWWFDVPLATCQARNQARDRHVPDEIIDRMWHQLADRPPHLAEGFDRCHRLRP